MDQIAEIVCMLLTHRIKPSNIEIEARLKKQLVTRDSLERLIDDEPGWQKKAYIERRRISKSNRRSVYRQRNDEVICKSFVAKEDVNDLWCTVHVSTEIPIPSMSCALEPVAPKTVIVYRKNVGSCYVDAIIDEDGEDASNIRIEVEVRDASAFDIDDFVSTVKHVCGLLQGSPMFVGFYEHRVLTHLAQTAFGEFCIENRKYQKPITMTMKELSEISATIDEWVVTPKVDGVRTFIVSVNDRFYAVDVAKNVRLEACADVHIDKISVLDCEYVDKTGVFYVFDLAVLNGEYFGKKPLNDRLDAIDELLELFPEQLRMRVAVKQYESVRSFDNLVRLYANFGAQYDMDGLVFMNASRDYMQPVVKWKAFSTVDLEVKNDLVTTSDGWNIGLPWKRMHERMSGVWEFMIVNDELIPTKPRPDKLNANSRMIVERNAERAVPGTLFSGVGCYMMRKYHNRVKSQLLSKANLEKAYVLDIGSGQGGDVSKWKKAAHVYCVEPSKSATDELLARSGNANNISVFNVALRDLDMADIPSKIDVFTAFFCTNMFEHADWEALQKLVIKKGSKHCRLLVIALTDPRRHSDDCFTITMRGLDEYIITLHETRITNIRETAVRPATLDKKMKECNMTKVTQEKLNDDTFMTNKERLLSSMYTMFVYKSSRRKG